LAAPSADTEDEEEEEAKGMKW